MTRKFKYKPNHIVKLIESIEECRLLEGNKTRGHYTFWRPAQFDKSNPHALCNACFISCIVSKDEQELHLIYIYPETGNVSQRILK